MNLVELVQQFENICLRHNYINSFSFGESEDEVLYGDATYPRAFLELPFNQSTNERFKTYRIGLIISDLYKGDSLSDSERIEILSQCEDWINQIIFQLKKESPANKILFSSDFSFSLLYLISHTTDNSLAVRAEFDIQIINTSCSNTVFS